jgi:hypothetical protein
MKRGGAAHSLLPRVYDHLIARFFLLALLACASEDDVTGPANPSLGNPEITITAIDPDTATVDTMVTVLITGSGFTDSSTATWLIDTTAAPGIATLSTTFKSSTEIEAVILISPDAALRSYSVRIRGKKGKQGIAVEKFRVVAKPTELPRPGHASAASDINDSGVIVGSSYNDATGEPIAVRWTPVDSGWSYSILGLGGAIAINNAGLIARVHFDRAARAWHSWIYTATGDELDFGPVSIVDISNNGTIVGRIYDDALRSTDVVWRQLSPTTWGAAETLSIPAGFTTASLSRINGVGDVVGFVSNSDPYSFRAVVWKFRNGQWLIPDPVDLQLPSGASAINDAGAMVGHVTPCVVRLPNCYPTPVFWPSVGAARRMLPTLYNTQGFVSGVNNANLAVGSAWVHWNSGSLPLTAMVQHAVIWFPGSQWPEDLGAIHPSEYGEAVAINNHGWIAGTTQRSFFDRFATVWKLPASLTVGASVATRR